jgi:hypothetical protein
MTHRTILVHRTNCGIAPFDALHKTSRLASCPVLSRTAQNDAPHKLRHCTKWCTAKSLALDALQKVQNLHSSKFAQFKMMHCKIFGAKI